MSLLRSTGLPAIFLLLAGVAIPVGAQTYSNSDDQARQRRAEFDRKQAEVKARIDASRRKMNLPPADSRPLQPGSFNAQLSAEDKAWFEKAHAKNAAIVAKQFRPRYTFDGSREFAYRFDLRLTTGQRSRYVAGWAAFDLLDKSAGSYRVLARDNLQQTAAPDQLREQAIGELTSMLKRTMHVDDEGSEPDVDGDLPAVLGNLEDWFFPPLPDHETVARDGGETVIREADGKWDTVGFYNSKDRGAKGWYDWSVQARGVSGGVLTVADKRSLRSNDGSTELVGSGSYTFDMQRGILLTHSFRGTYKERGSSTQIALEISPAPTTALDP
jgi:hypothetical protein